jgi:hypothetical protein
VEFRWRGHTQGQLEFSGPSPFVAHSVNDLLGHLRARADEYTDDELTILGASAMYMALRDARFAKAGSVIGAAEKLLDAFYPVLSPDRANRAFQRGSEQLLQHLLPLRGDHAHVLVDEAFSFLSQLPGWRAA